MAYKVHYFHLFYLPTQLGNPFTKLQLIKSTIGFKIVDFAFWSPIWAYSWPFCTSKMAQHLNMAYKIHLHCFMYAPILATHLWSYSTPKLTILYFRPTFGLKFCPVAPLSGHTTQIWLTGYIICIVLFTRPFTPSMYEVTTLQRRY